MIIKMKINKIKYKLNNNNNNNYKKKIKNFELYIC